MPLRLLDSCGLSGNSGKPGILSRFNLTNLWSRKKACRAVTAELPSLESSSLPSGCRPPTLCTLIGEISRAWLFELFANLLCLGPAPVFGESIGLAESSSVSSWFFEGFWRNRISKLPFFLDSGAECSR